MLLLFGVCVKLWCSEHFKVGKETVKGSQQRMPLQRVPGSYSTVWGLHSKGPAQWGQGPSMEREQVEETRGAHWHLELWALSLAFAALIVAQGMRLGLVQREGPGRVDAPRGHLNGMGKSKGLLRCPEMQTARKPCLCSDMRMGWLAT